MIAKLRGIVDSVGDGQVVLDVSGVGYRVFCSGRTLARLAEGGAASLLIETHMREDHIHLYGFYDSLEKECYCLLITVQGVGAKVGLAILTVLSPDQVATAIASGDRAALSRAAGVGARLAARITSELKDKVVTSIPCTVDDASGKDHGGGDNLSDAVSALVNLGYNPSEAFTAVSRVAAGLGEDPKIEDLIRAALAELVYGS